MGALPRQFLVMALEHKGALGETCERGIVSTWRESLALGDYQSFLHRGGGNLPSSSTTSGEDAVLAVPTHTEGSSPRVALAGRGSGWSEPRQGRRGHKGLLPHQAPLMGARSASMLAFADRDLPRCPAATAHGPPDTLRAQQGRGGGVPKAGLLPPSYQLGDNSSYSRLKPWSICVLRPAQPQRVASAVPYS